jgi:peptide/nickel transport system substrate-binding protein
MGARRDLAVGTMTRWRAQHGGKPLDLTISLPEGPGMDLLFLALRTQLARVGVTLERVDRNADMTLIDEVAPYDSVAWYLGRVSCARDVHCSKEAEELLKASLTAAPEERLRLLGEAEPLIETHGGFIPLATPVRWSLVSPRLDGFAPSPRGQHNLTSLTR